jgi:Rod binding domain-containing protein
MDINHIDNSAMPVQNKNAVSSQEEQKLKKAAQSFESFFIAMLFEKMQKTAGSNNMYGKGTSGEVYQQLFNQALGDKMASQGGFGLSKMMVETLRKKEALSSPKLLDTIDR